MATRGLIKVELKADNELSISVPVYFKSVKKWKYVLRKKKRKTKQNDQNKTVKKKFPMAGAEPRTFDV